MDNANIEWQNVDIPSITSHTLEYDDTSECRYRYDRLAKVVYLISENAMKNLEVDRGIAYANGITETPLMLNVYDMNLQDSETLDERYQFSHQLTFSVKGYSNYMDFYGRFYVIVKDYEDNFWLVNPLFPCKVTFTYTLDANSSHTDFTLSTISNFPMLRLYEKIDAEPYICEGYNMTSFSSLMLNQRKYSFRNDSNNIIYTNDGFKDVVFNKNSQVFSETFDGTNVEHNITFNIGFSDYKSSWHYNILEFADNKYSAVIKDSKGRWITCGFGNGLQPSYTVTCTDKDEPNRIEITLKDIHDEGNFATYTNIGTIAYTDSTSFQYTKNHNGYECVGENLARYLLKEEVDALFNPTGRYQCLVGYEDRFTDLNIVGTFSETETFASTQCSAQECLFYTSMPQTISFNMAECKTYSFKCDTDWSIASNNQNITVTPSEGLANTEYTLQVCNNYVSSETLEAELTLTYCEKTTEFGVLVTTPDTCLTQGNAYNITANAQVLSIPTVCCVSSVTNTTDVVNTIQIYNGYVRMNIPQNMTGSGRTIPLVFTYCDGATSNVVINQGIMYQRWVKELTTCDNGQKCDVERLYSGTSSTDINTRTSVVRLTNCSASTDCMERIVRWVDSEETVCYNGNKYIIQYEQISYDNGTSWSNTGNKRRGAQIADPSGDCAHSEEDYEYQWVITDLTDCRNYNKYYQYKKQRKLIEQTSEDWEDVIPTVYSIDGNGTMPLVIAEENSEECGYTPPIVPQYKWVVMSGSNDFYCSWCDPSNVTQEWQFMKYVCIDGDKYEIQVLRESDDNQIWYDAKPQQTRRILVESGSTECI